MTILTVFAQTPLILAVGLAGIGIFASIYHPVGMSWLVSWTSKTGTALGFNGLFGSIGFFAPLVAGTLTGLWSWQVAFIVPWIVCLGVGVLFSISLRTILKDEETLAHRAVSGSNSPNSILMTFGLMAVALFFSGMFHQIIQFSLPKDFDLRVLFTSGSLLVTGSMVGYAYSMEFFIAWYSGNRVEAFAFVNRAFGPYYWAYWTMIFCNVVVPQFFWSKKLRRNRFIF